jgi:hypothetical protein
MASSAFYYSACLRQKWPAQNIHNAEMGLITYWNATQADVRLLSPQNALVYR